MKRAWSSSRCRPDSAPVLADKPEREKQGLNKWIEVPGGSWLEAMAHITVILGAARRPPDRFLQPKSTPDIQDLVNIVVSLRVRLGSIISRLAALYVRQIDWSPQYLFNLFDQLISKEYFSVGGDYRCFQSGIINSMRRSESFQNVGAVWTAVPKWRG